MDEDREVWHMPAKNQILYAVTYGSGDRLVVQVNNNTKLSAMKNITESYAG